MNKDDIIKLLSDVIKHYVSEESKLYEEIDNLKFKIEQLLQEIEELK